jgi:hypothetical protein
MAGLNYGRKYMAKPFTFPEGVSFVEKLNKWIVRVKKQKANLTTIAQFDKKEDAEKYYNDFLLGG